MPPCFSSLLSSCPLRWLLGDLISTSQRACFILTHKLLLVKVPPSPCAAFTLVGYLAGSSEGEVLGKALQSVLRVWSDTSALRHMDLRQHLWLSKVAMLGIVCLPAGERSKLQPGERCAYPLSCVSPWTLIEVLLCGSLQCLCILSSGLVCAYPQHCNIW